MAEHVHLRNTLIHDRNALSPDFMTRIERAVEGLASLSVGDEAPPETTVLVDGRAKGDLGRYADLRAVVIPWAGVSRELAEAIRSKPGVKLYNLHHNAPAVAELAVGMLIACARGIVPADAALRQGRWEMDHSVEGVQLAGKRAAILGYGEIGRRIGATLKAIGMEVVGIRATPGETTVDGIRVVGEDRRDETIAASNLLVVTLPLTPETEGSVGTREIESLREPRLLINVGRGPVVQEEALYDALKSGVLKAAGIDVWYRYADSSQGPHFPANLPFWELPNVVMSPHVGGLSGDAEDLRSRALADLLPRLLRHEDVPSVGLDRGY